MILAFDPGVNQQQLGGYCMLDTDSFLCSAVVLEADEMPYAGRTVDVPEIVRRVNGHLTEDTKVPLVAVERQHARPQDSHLSMNVALPAYGQLIGMAQALGWPLTLVDPKDWKRVVLRGTKRDKEAACAYVSRRHPTVSLYPGRCRKPRDGIADAVCIAEWAYRSTP